MRNKTAPYVKVPMWFAVEAAKATKTTKALVWVWLVYLGFKTHRTTFPVPNSKLQKLGVNRYTKRRALCELERAGLITVERRHGKTPVISLVTL
jgi:hypothetical protein